MRIRYSKVGGAELDPSGRFGSSGIPHQIIIKRSYYDQGRPN